MRRTFDIGFFTAGLLLLFASFVATAAPSKVTAGAYVNRVLDVNFKESRYSADIYIWFRWKAEGELADYKPLETMELMNGKVESVTGVVEKKIGDVNYAQARVSATVFHNFELANFPFDSHRIHVDIEDSALRGLRALREPDADGGVVLSMIGGNVAIGLIWKGEFCALRTLALPVRAPRDSDEFEEHLALHIQRTVDLFERQARQLSIRQVVASLPTLREQALQTLQGALPMPTHRFELEQAFDLADGVEALCHAHGDLVALAAVAAARLLDRDAATQATMAAASPQRAAEVAA